MDKFDILEDVADNENDQNSYILNSADEPRFLDHAIGSIEINGSKYRYFGTNLYKNIEKTHKNTQIKVKERQHVIVLETGEILNENKLIKLQYSFATKMNQKGKGWTKDGIRAFREKKFDSYTIADMFASFRKHFDHYVSYDFDQWYDVYSLWCMITYFQDQTDMSLILKLEGPSGSGKSKTAKVIRNLAFNGKSFLSPTPANFFRYRHANKSTLIFEEAERLYDDSVRKQAGDSSLIEYLNGSYERGNTVPRQNDKDLSQTDEFDPFGWSVIVSIKPLKGATKNRALIGNHLQAKANDPRGSIEVPSDSPEFSASRDLAYAVSLLQYREFLNKFGSLQTNFGLANRQWLCAKPLIALAFCVSEDLAHKVANFISTRFYQETDPLSAKSWEYVLICSLLDLTINTQEVVFVSNEALHSRFLELVEDKFCKITPNKITKIMRSLGFTDYAGRNSTRTQRGFILSFLKVCEIVIRSQKIDKEIILKKVSEVSKVSDISKTCINKDIFIKWYTDTFSDTSIFDLSVSDTSDGLDTFHRGYREKLQSISNKFPDGMIPKNELESHGFSVEIVERLLKVGELFEPRPNYVKLFD